MSKQVSLPKISLILQKWSSAQKPIYALFAQRPSISSRTVMVKQQIHNLKSFWLPLTEMYFMGASIDISTNTVYIVKYVSH